MKKTLLYLPAAAILGILVTVVPLITIVEIGSGDKRQNAPYASLFSESFGRLEGHHDLKTSNNSELAVLAIGFVIAFVVYTFVKHRMPSRDHIQPVRIPPY